MKFSTISFIFVVKLSEFPLRTVAALMNCAMRGMWNVENRGKSHKVRI